MNYKLDEKQSHFDSIDTPIELETISIRGAREHNLKNVHLDIPKKKLIVFTGVSGSGKSSLAFDTIFAEGQRRYVQSLSAYARQFIGQMDKPQYDTIRGLCPAIAIDQKAAGTNPRSTVGTITEIHDYLRVLYARIGEQHCIKCGNIVGRGSAQSMVEQISTLPPKSKILILAPVVENRKGEHKEVLQNLIKSGFARVRADGVVQNIEDVQALARHQKHTLEVVIDRLVTTADPSFKKRLTDSVEMALKWGGGRLIVHVMGREDLKMSEARACCGVAYPELTPQLFSFNSPQGMCPECNGLGTQLRMDEDKLIPDRGRSIADGAIIPWRSYLDAVKGLKNSWGGRQINALRRHYKIDFHVPWDRLSGSIRDIILYGSKGRQMTVSWNSAKINGQFRTSWEGIIPTMMRRYRQTRSEGQKKYYGKFMSSKPCPSCNGQRLKPAACHVRVANRSIVELTSATISEAQQFLGDLTLTGSSKVIAEELLKEIHSRLGFLLNVGLDYLSLDRKGPSLSGGESQRIRLASQVGSELTGVLYILDEPSIGLHQRDNLKLLSTLQRLRDIGNTLIVIEHDQETMQSADWIVDIGPGAGLLGGQVIAQGPFQEICRNPVSVTGQFLSGQEKILTPQKRRTPKKVGDKHLTIKKAAANNLKNITAKIPLGLMVAD